MNILFYLLFFLRQLSYILQYYSYVYIHSVMLLKSFEFLSIVSQFL